MRNRLVFVLLLAAGLRATEIRTGAMLGRHYDARAFYVRGAPGESWQKTYTGANWRHEAQGKLMNLRIGPGNPDAAIDALDRYKSHGVLMLDVSFESAQENAFRPDGSLQPAWFGRLERLLRATDQRGMIVNLIYFHHGQDQQFQSTAAINSAARNITDWLIAGNFRNVIVDVAGDYDSPRWGFAGYIPQNIIPLIDDVRERFKHAGYAAPIGASSDGRRRYPASLTGQVDVVLIHGNAARRAAELKDVQRPVLIIGDDDLDHIASLTVK